MPAFENADILRKIITYYSVNTNPVADNDLAVYQIGLSYVDNIDGYALHNKLLKVLKALQTNRGIFIDDIHLCSINGCENIKIPGYNVCHWHGASADPDSTILANMMTAISYDGDLVDVQSLRNGSKAKDNQIKALNNTIAQLNAAIAAKDQIITDLQSGGGV